MTMTEYDAELAAVLVCLAPLGERGLRYVNVDRREFSYRDMLDSQGWSSGERQLICVAGALWNTAPVDLSYIASMGGEFFQAIIDALAARRGQDFRSDYRAAALARA